ncbi:MAG: protein kinase, partial [Bradymonadaceae bacterium]
MSDEESSLPEVGDVVGGRFRIVEHLGTGGFGTVYRAIQKNIGREVALKFLTPGVAEDPINVERFRREAYHVSQLRHPNTITLFDYGQTEGGLVYMVMELLDGVSLAGTLEDEGALPLARAAHIFIKVLKSLSEAHDHGLVHRDLKPENIYLCEMFGQKDYVKVLDFGVAKMTQMGGDESGGSDLTKQGHIFGTPMYMAPEQACDEAITPATDTYSLGLLLFEMITGMPPVTGESRMDVIHKQIKDPVPKLPQALEGTPLGRIIRQACVKDEEERFQNAGEFVDAFVDAIREMNIVPQPEGEAEPEMAFALAGSAVPEETEQADREHPADTDTTVTAVGAEETRPAEPAEIDDETQTISEGDILDDAVAEKPELPDDQDERRRHQRGRARYDLPLVGREDILEELTEIVGESVQASDGHIVLLEGESGIGKTRVIHALAERASSRGMVVPIGHFRQRAAPMEGVREALADYWGVSHRDRAEVREALEADLADAESFTDEEIDFLVDFIRPKTSRDTPVPESPEEARALYARLERIFLKLAERDPLLIVFEDIQHSDSATLAFLEYLAVTLRTEPAEIVVAMTLRPEERASNPDLEPSLKTMNANIGVGFTRVPLRRLQGNDLAELLDAILPLEPKLKERVGWLSQGVPLHAIQIIRYLENEGRLVENASGRMELAEGSPRDIDLPPDLMDLMELRIDQAAEAGRDEEQVRAVLEWLAVLGVRTPVELLERVAEKTERIDVDRLDETLEALSEEGILRQVLHRNLLCAEFDNSLIRETLLEGLSGRWANQRYNREAAVEKVEFYRQRGQEIPLVEVADHWRKAGELEKYRDALFEAAHRSMERFDPRGARDRFRELLPLLDELDDRSDKWVRTHLALAELGRRFGEFGVAEEHYRSVIEEGHATAEQRAQALRGLGELLVVQARYDEARDIFGRALTLSRDSEPVDFPGVAKALTGLSKVALLQGEPEEGARVRKQLKDVLPELPEGEISGKVLVHLSEVAKRLGRMSD